MNFQKYILFTTNIIIRKYIFVILWIKVNGTEEYHLHFLFHNFFSSNFNAKYMYKKCWFMTCLSWYVLLSFLILASYLIQFSRSLKTIVCLISFYSMSYTHRFFVVAIVILIIDFICTILGLFDRQFFNFFVIFLE